MPAPALLEPLPDSPLAEPECRKPRILIVARWPVGGIRTHLSTNCPALVNAGYRCTFVVPQDESLPDVRDALEGLPGTEFVSVPVRGHDCTLWRSVRALLQSGRFGLVHAHGLTAAAHTALATLGEKVPFLVTLHEPLRQAQFPGLAGACKRWLLGRALARASAIVTVSEDSRANLLRTFPNLRKLAMARIHAISNGIDASRFPSANHEETSDLRQELGLDEDVILIGYLGRFMPEKGFGLLLEATRRLVKHGGVRRFHVVAFGSSDYRREYQHLIEQRALGRHITLRDFVADVVPVLEQLDLVVVPSLWEASSLVSMEAMAAGVPVLGSDCPGLREVLRGTPSRTVKAGEVSALEVGLREALADLWTADAQDFAPRARERFNNERSARRLLRLYDKLTSCSASRRTGVSPVLAAPPATPATRGASRTGETPVLRWEAAREVTP
jgi:glycosyltransferase involved in cell wall biosynthesis